MEKTDGEVESIKFHEQSKTNDFSFPPYSFLTL